MVRTTDRSLYCHDITLILQTATIRQKGQIEIDRMRSCRIVGRWSPPLKVKQI
jgi:hypothetical protein